MATASGSEAFTTPSRGLRVLLGACRDGRSKASSPYDSNRLDRVWPHDQAEFDRLDWRRHSCARSMWRPAANT